MLWKPGCTGDEGKEQCSLQHPDSRTGKPASHGEVNISKYNKFIKH